MSCVQGSSSYPKVVGNEEWGLRRRTEFNLLVFSYLRSFFSALASLQSFFDADFYLPCQRKCQLIYGGGYTA